MAAIFSWFLIPAAAALAAGSSGWLSSNFSVAGSQAPGSFFLLLWALLTGGFFRSLIRQSVSMAGDRLAAGRELAMTDLAVLLLVVSVLLPYRPADGKLLASIHVILAFSATVVFYLVITSLDLKLYFQYPGCFSLCTGLLGFAIAATAALLVLSGFMISSALEFFLTVFASLWLWLFRRRIRSLKRHWL